MKRPPLPVVVIVLLDVIAASSSFFVVDRIGMIGASVEFLVFGALAAGIWYLKKWAWFVAITFSAIQITVLVLGIGIALFASTAFEVSKDFAKGEFYAYMAGLIAINVFVIAVLSISKIRSEFH